MLGVRVLLMGALALMVTLSLSAGVSAAPISADKVKAVIQSAYDDQDTALVAHDLDGVMVPYAEDAIFIDDIPGAKRQGLEHQGLDVARQNWVDFDLSLRDGRLGRGGFLLSPGDVGSLLLGCRGFLGLGDAHIT